MEKKTKVFNMKVNEINDTKDPTKKDVSFIIHDFEVSHNNSFISKETAKRALDSLFGKPIVCQYFPVSEEGAKDDALGGHGAKLGEDRENGDYIIEFDTVPIGTFTAPATIETIVDENGQEKEVVVGKGILWSDRFSNVVGLIQEWVENGIDVVSSMEIVYDEYHVKDGVEEILNYWYSGHCILNSETRGEHEKVYPAYDVSKLNYLVAQALNQGEKDKESVKVFKKVYELSHDDIRSLLYKKLDSTLEKNQFSYIVDTYDNKFVACIETYDGNNYTSNFYQFEYTKTENDVEINFDSKTEVFLEKSWVAVDSVKELEDKLNEVNEELQALTAEKEELEESKKKIEEQFNEASEKLIQLNAQVEELKEYKEKYDQEQFEKKLQENIELYSAKFEALGAKEKFESEEVQNLIKESVVNEEAIIKLNSILVDLVTIDSNKEKEEKEFVQFSQKREQLLDVAIDFDSRYK